MPAETPVTTPFVVTVAIEGVRLLQRPPVVDSLKLVVLPTQTDLVPPIEAGAEGMALMVTVVLPDIEFEQVVATLVPTTV